MTTRTVKTMLVRTTSPEDLDESLQYVGATVLVHGHAGGPVLRHGCCVIECFGNPWLVEETIRVNGLGQIVRHPHVLALRDAVAAFWRRVFHR